MKIGRLKRHRQPLDQSLKFIMEDFIEQLSRQVPKINKAKIGQKAFKVIVETEGRRHFEITFVPPSIKISGLDGPK